MVAAKIARVDQRLPAYELSNSLVAGVLRDSVVNGSSPNVTRYEPTAHLAVVEGKHVTFLDTVAVQDLR